ncbi:MAG: DUF58 domain-containing protein [bacterium]
MSSGILDPQALARIANLELRAKTVVEGFLTGLHQSPYHGFSVEFAQHRPYNPGDNLKHLDYRVLARTERYYIKQFQEETNLKAYLLVDHSASMGFPPPNLSGEYNAVTKLHYAVSLAASLAFLLLRQRDAVGLVPFAEKVDAILPPRSAMGYLETLLVQLEGLKAEGQTRTSSVLFEIAERVTRRGLVVLISDLWDDPDRVLSSLRAVRYVGHEVILFQVLHPREIEFNFSRDGLFQDLETNEELPVRPWHLKDHYQKHLKAHLERIKSEARAARIDYFLCPTDQPYEIALFEFLVRRKRLM